MCDTVSQFRGFAKRLTLDTYKLHSELLDGIGVGQLTDDTLAAAEAFVCKVYLPDTEITSVNSLRCKRFHRGGVELEKLPATKDALSHHIKPSYIQARVWRQLGLTAHTGS